MNKEEQTNNESQVSTPRTITNWQEAQSKGLKLGDVVWELQDKIEPLSASHGLEDYYNQFPS